MTDLALAPARAAAPATGATSASGLAARIEVPAAYPSATTASRSGTCQTAPTRCSSPARTRGGAGTCSAKRSRRAGRCSSAPASTRP